MSELYRLKNLKRARCVRCGKMVWQDNRTGAVVDASSRNRCDHQTIDAGNAKQNKRAYPIAYPIQSGADGPRIGWKD